MRGRFEEVEKKRRKYSADGALFLFHNLKNIIKIYIKSFFVKMTDY